MAARSTRVSTRHFPVSGPSTETISAWALSPAGPSHSCLCRNNETMNSQGSTPSPSNRPCTNHHSTGCPVLDDSSAIRAEGSVFRSMGACDI
ncbi:MAG: hypothetical protein NTV93_06610 [Verrucomicrobia bacterium]|nr:hypothetical protein [Verrucomicrobiota bacterium]